MDPVVEALKRLCGTTAQDRIDLADRLGVSEQNLYQIVSGTLLKFGKPRSVGRRLREKLDAHYPGWLVQSSNAAARNGEQPVSLTQALDLVELALERINPADRTELLDAFGMWVKHGKKYRQPVEELLRHKPEKQQANGR